VVRTRIEMKNKNT